MKIILISFLGRGGMLHYSSQLANALSEKNEVALVIPSYCNTDYFNKNISIIRINAPPNALKTFVNSFNFFALFKLLQTIRIFNPDIIHFVNDHPWNIIICIFLKNIKKVLTLHDPIPHEKNFPGKVIQPFFSICDKITINQVNKIIVHGKYLKAVCISLGIPELKIAVIPHGEYSFFNKKGKVSPINCTPYQKNILFFGRIEPYKGLEYFIRAADEVIKSIPDISITIAGDGNFYPYKKLIVNTPNFIIINRYISDEEVNALFYNTDIVVLPYISATQSGVIPIAYAFKKPVIASSVGAIPEVVDNGLTGYLVPPKDIGAIANAIIKLMNNDVLRNTMGENGYKKSETELSWKVIAKKHETTYQNLFNRL